MFSPHRQVPPVMQGAEPLNGALPDLNEYISEILEEERKQTRGPLTSLLWTAFAGSRAALEAFYTGILLKKIEGGEKSSPTVVITGVQQEFLRVWLERARSLGLEQTREELLKSAPLKNMQLVSSKRMLVRYAPSYGQTIERQYDTKLSLVLAAAVLTDARLKRRAARIIHLPHSIIRALLEASKYLSTEEPQKTVEFILELMDERARGDPFVAYVLRCPFLYSTSLLELDAIRGEERISAPPGHIDAVRSSMADKTSPVAEVDEARLVLAGYLYYRMRTEALDVPHEVRETAFAFVMYALEEALHGEERTVSTLQLASEAYREAACRDIATHPRLFERALRVARDMVLFCIGRAAPIAEGASRNVPARFDAIYESTTDLKDTLDRLRAIARITEDRAVQDSKKRLFAWISCTQVGWEVAKQDLGRTPASAKTTTQLSRFVDDFPDACAFLLEGTEGFEAFRRTVRHLNHVHPTFAFRELAYEGFLPDGRPLRHEINADDIASIARVRWSHSARANSSDPFEALNAALDSSAVVSDSRYFILLQGTAARTYVIFSSPRAHQLYCNFAMLEQLTTPKQRKVMPAFPFLMRQYGAVFSRFEWCPTNMEHYAKQDELVAAMCSADFGAGNLKPPPIQERIRTIELNDDHENLWIFVQVIFYQLTRVAVATVKRKEDSFRSSLLDIDEEDFIAYRLFHGICGLLDDFMDMFPFYFRCAQAKEWKAKHRDEEGVFRLPFIAIGDASEERANGFVWVCEILLCFMCLGTMHTLSGGIIHSLYEYLIALPEARRHKHDALVVYLDMIKALHPDRRLISPGNAERIDLIFNTNAAETHELGRYAASLKTVSTRNASERLCISRVNHLFYAFITDRSLEMGPRGELLVDMDFKEQRVNRGVYKRQAKAAEELVKKHQQEAASSAKRPRCGIPEVNDLRAPPAAAAASGTPDPFFASPVPSPSPNSPYQAFVPTTALSKASEAYFRVPAPRPPTRKPPQKETSEAPRPRSLTSAMFGVPDLARIRTQELPVEFLSLTGMIRKRAAGPGELRHVEVPSFRASAAKVPTMRQGIYMGLEEFYTCAAVREMCRRYSESFCFDTTWDVAKNYILRAISIAINRERAEMEEKRREQLRKLDEDAKMAEAEGSNMLTADVSREADLLGSVMGDIDDSQHSGAHIEVAEEDGTNKILSFDEGVYGDNDRVMAMNQLAHKAAASLGKALPPEPTGRIAAVDSRGVPMPRPPVAYITGTVAGDMETLKRRLNSLGQWRYELASQFQVLNDLDEDRLKKNANFGPMAEFLRMLEKTLHYRSVSLAVESKVSARRCKLSKNFWWINADQFMARQLNSRLPVSYNILGRAGHSGAAPTELLNNSENIWAVRTGSPFSLLEDSGWTVSLDTPQGVRDAEVERGVPSASGDLAFLCREYSGTCSALISAASEGRLTRHINGLPVVRLVLGELAKLASTKEGLLVDPLNEFDDSIDDDISHGGSAAGHAATTSSGTPDSADLEVMDCGLARGTTIEDLMGDVNGINFQAESGAKVPATWAVAMYMGERVSEAETHPQ